MEVHIDGLRHETSGLCEKTNSIYIVFTPCFYLLSPQPRPTDLSNTTLLMTVRLHVVEKLLIVACLKWTIEIKCNDFGIYRIYITIQKFGVRKFFH